MQKMKFQTIFDVVWPIIPNGKEVLTKEKANIISLIDNAIKKQTDQISDEDINCMMLAKMHCTSFDIENYDVNIARQTAIISNNLRRGYDLAIYYYLNKDENELANILYMFEGFIYLGEARKVNLNKKYFMPKKVQSEVITNLDKELKINVAKEDENIESARQFIITI